MSINEYFGTLLQSVTEAHKQHLMTGKYSKHKALNEFYDEMPELIDSLIEHYQGEHGKVEGYKNTIMVEGKDAVKYMEELLEYTKKGQDEFFMNDKSLSSDVDAIVGLIDSTLYQLKELKETKILSLKDYLTECILESSPENMEFAHDIYEILKSKSVDLFGDMAKKCKHNPFDTRWWDNPEKDIVNAAKYDNNMADFFNKVINIILDKMQDDRYFMRWFGTKSIIRSWVFSSGFFNPITENEIIPAWKDFIKNCDEKLAAVLDKEVSEEASDYRYLKNIIDLAIHKMTTLVYNKEKIEETIELPTGELSLNISVDTKGVNFSKVKYKPAK